MTILIAEDNRTIAQEMAIALNAAGHEPMIIALNFDLLCGEPDEVTGLPAPPVELLLVPAGPTVTGRDGRSWGVPSRQAILDYFTAAGLDIPVDIEHATQLKAPAGDPAPAQAWGTALRIDADGAIYGTFDWNCEGIETVSRKRAYRYYSPAYVIDKATQTIVGIKSVGLTNTPNLYVPALNREQPHQEESMELKVLLAALGLAPTATFDEALNSITKLKGDLTVALNAAETPPVDRFVPRADYDLALNRATTAEGKLADQAKTALEVSINTEIAAALKAGKITPATRDYHVAQCRQEGGLERFKQFVAAAPVIAADVDLNREKFEDTQLNAEQEKVAGMFGNTAEDINKYGK